MDSHRGGYQLYWIINENSVYFSVVASLFQQLSYNIAISSTYTVDKMLRKFNSSRCYGDEYWIWIVIIMDNCLFVMTMKFANCVTKIIEICAFM